MNVLMPHIRSLIKPAFETVRIHRSIGMRSYLVLFLFAFVFRMVYVYQSTDNPLFGVPVVDARAYQEWALKMVDGLWLWDSVGNYLPIYPAFLAVQQILLGPHPIVNKILQSIMGALSAVLIAQVAARAWNRRVGVIAGYLIATNWMLVIFESEKFAEAFSIFFLSATLWILIRFPHRLFAVFAAGFMFSLAAGTRANLFMLFPFIIFWLIWKKWNHRVVAFTSAILFSIGTCLIIGPIVYRNYQLAGVPMLRTQATWSLYSGLDPEFEGLHPPDGILFRKYMAIPLRNGFKTAPEIERFWGQKCLQVVRQKPLAVGANFLKRVLIFFNAREWSQEIDVYTYRRYSSFLSLPWTGFWLIGPFGLLGLCLNRCISKDTWLIFGFTVISFLSIIAFKVSDRYRLPFAALLTIFAAFALWQIYEWAKTRNKQALGTAIPILVILCLISWPDWLNLDARRVARFNFELGLHHEIQGRHQEAIRAYETSMKDFAWDPDSAYRIGRILLGQGQDQRAMSFLKEALHREPQFPGAMNALARIELNSGNVRAAEMRVKASLQLNPINQDTLMLMAQIEYHEGNTAQEIEWLTRAVDLGKNFEPAMKLAARLNQLGHYEDAVHLYDYVMRSREADKAVRVSAAMKAGLTVARHFYNHARATIYWQYIIDNFLEFRFFSLQAEFFMGILSEERFRRRMGNSPEWRTAAEYVIGLKHRLNGHMSEAVEAYQRCLQISSDQHAGELSTSQKWAQEDLKHIRQAR